VKKLTTFFLAFFVALSAFSQASKDYTVQIQLSVTQSPLRFHLSWDNAATATQYKVFSKNLFDLSWTERATLSANDTTFTDSAVSVGQGIEYQVVKFTPNYNGYGYIYAAHNLDEYNNRGKLLLLVDSNFKQPLSAEITQLQKDLIGDGWQIVTQYVPRSATPPQVKQHITTLWQQDSANFKSVYILGHVAVPYSGYIGPDGHNDHFGAWAADLYYSVVDNTPWTDFVLNVTSASRAANRNIPGDGKFDVDDIIPGSAKLQVGRVDMFDMPAFGMSDTALTRRYLQKAHNFKVNQYPVVQRGMIDDEIGGFGGEAFVRGGWGSYAGMFGDSIIEGGFLPDGKLRSYMFAVTSGFGSYTSSSGVASTSSLVTDSIAIPFTSHFGSYFGDWDNTNNLLKAFIASKSLTLTATWSGRPVYYFHQMALGQPVGHSALMSANSPRNLYHSVFSSNSVHMALMGDPSLRLHPMSPASNLVITSDCEKIKLKWATSSDTNISGYRIYRAETLNDKFEWVATVATDSFEDKNAPAGSYYYMVRVERLQKTPSGTYYNLSLGIMDSISYYPAPSPKILVNDTSKCLGESFIIKDSTSYNGAFNQYFLIDNVPQVYNDSLIFMPNTEGKYQLKLIVTSPFGCTDSSSLSLTSNAVPNADFAVANNGLCVDSNEFRLAAVGAGANHKYFWIFSNGDTLVTDLMNASKKFTQSGSYTVQLLVEDSLTGCNSLSTLIFPFNVYPRKSAPIINGSSILKQRVPSTYTVNAPNSLFDYVWSVNQNPDLFQPNDDSLTLRWDNGLLTATIKLVERDTAGCKSDTAYFQVWTIINSIGEADKDLKIYPSPNLEGELTIFNDNLLQGEADIYISNMNGKEFLQQKVSFVQGENKINISSLETGIYFLIIRQNDFQAAYKFLRVKQW
jgi:PKD repeat protein